MTYLGLYSETPKLQLKNYLNFAHFKTLIAQLVAALGN